MPTLNIEGVGRVTVDENFATLPPDEQERVIGDIVSQTGSGGDSANDVTALAAGEYIEGIPIVGPYIRGGADRLGAGIRSAIYDTDYEDELAFIQGRNADLEESHPNLATGANIVGGVAGMAPAVMAAPAAFGAGGGSLLARSGAGALSGGAIGGADAAVRSDGDIGEIAQGALFGGALGGVSPLAGDLISGGYNRVMNWFQGPSRAQANFGRAAQADDVAGDMADRLAALGDDAMPMDLGPNLQQQAGALAATPGPGQQTIRSAVRARNAGATGRITGALDDTFGPARDPGLIDDAIRVRQRALGPDYEDAFLNARRVDTSPIAQNLDAMKTRLRGDAQRAIGRVRDMLNITGTDQLDPNPRTLFETRHAIDAMMDTADKNAAPALTIARQQIDRELGRAVPGIKAVDARHAELARQSEAMALGQRVLEAGKTAPRPTTFADDFASRTPRQQVRMRQGARAEIDRIVGNNANDRVALNKILKGEGDWNRDRLVTLFGSKKADRILGVMDREARYYGTSQTVTQNSQTAARQAGQAEIGTPGGFPEPPQTIWGTVIKGGQKLVGALRNETRTASNAELADLLAARDPKTVTAAIRAVQASQRRGDITQAVARETLQALGIGVAPAAIGASSMPRNVQP